MKIPIYQVDAFSSRLFAGNPAAVCALDQWLDDETLQNIAAENNLSETAFMVRNATGFDLRWFTPVTEVRLCGHATLAGAFVAFNCLGWPGDTVKFQSRWSGVLEVKNNGDLLTLNFPARPVHETEFPPGLEEALGVPVQRVYGSAEDLLAVLGDEKAVRAANPDFTMMKKISGRGIIITARGTDCDFVSRFFAPAAGIPEDPVTGSAHCVLVPYWAGMLKRNQFHARQVSARGGDLFCKLEGGRVLISGRAVLYMEGAISHPNVNHPASA